MSELGQGKKHHAGENETGPTHALFEVSLTEQECPDHYGDEHADFAGRGHVNHRRKGEGDQYKDVGKRVKPRSL